MAGDETKVQVAVRCRPVSAQEKKMGRPCIIQCNTKSNEITLLRSKMNKTYSFDRVYGAYATQKEVFKQTVKPIIDEALMGFNCTIFAYGQTGTGKTHTIQGNLDPDDDMAGIIPRSIRYIFDHLQQNCQDYSVRVSFMQLYNEELSDLLDPDNGKKLRLMEDTKKGGVYCQNLLDIPAQTAKDVFELLAKGVSNRICAETLLNENSSRSHSIFTIHVHSKESIPGGEDVLRTGKLNLVDLAGSECIGRSGAKNARAREAGNINQSLLTLGRVITALVDRHPHIPYRDSKLTRLLQESLGGRAKTTIIATLAPCADALDETISTLDYAFRAKNIKNRPEVNQRISKHAMLKECNQEIDSLRMALQAARDKDGVYLNPAQFAEMQDRMAGQAAQITELEDVLELKESRWVELEMDMEAKTEQLELQSAELEDVKIRLQEKQTRLEETERNLILSQKMLETSEKKVQAYQTNENFLLKQADKTLKMFDAQSKEKNQLHDKIGQKYDLSEKMVVAINVYADEAQEGLAAIQSLLNNYVSSSNQDSQQLLSLLKELTMEHKKHLENAKATLQNASSLTDSMTKDFLASVSKEHECTQDTLSGVASTWSEALQASMSEEIKNISSTVREKTSRLWAQLDDCIQKVRGMETLVLRIIDESKNKVGSFVTMQQTQLVQLGELIKCGIDSQLSSMKEQRASMDSFSNEYQKISRSKMDLLLQQIGTMLQSYQSNQCDLVTRSISAMHGESENGANALEVFASQLTTHNDVLAQSCMDLNSSINSSVAAAQHTSTSQSQDLVANLEAVKAVTGDTSQNQIKQCEVMSSNLHEAMDSLRSNCSTALVTNKEWYGDITQKCKDSLQGVVEIISIGSKDVDAFGLQMESRTSAVSQEVQALETHTCQSVLDMTNKLDQNSKQVYSFRASIKQDVPTGTTPKKSVQIVLPKFTRTVVNDENTEPSSSSLLMDNINSSESVTKFTEKEELYPKKRGVEDTGLRLPQKYHKSDELERIHSEPLGDATDTQ